jgi:hypothetical protein
MLFYMCVLSLPPAKSYFLRSASLGQGVVLIRLVVASTNRI